MLCKGSRMSGKMLHRDGEESCLRGTTVLSHCYHDDLVDPVKCDGARCSGVGREENKILLSGSVDVFEVTGPWIDVDDPGEASGLGRRRTGASIEQDLQLGLGTGSWLSAR